MRASQIFTLPVPHQLRSLMALPVLTVMATQAYSRTKSKFWYVDFSILSHEGRQELQLPVRRGKVKSVDHTMNLHNLFRQLFNHPKTLKDIGITAERQALVMSAT